MSSFRVPFHHLKELILAGGPRDIFGFLHRLDHPRKMDNLHLTLHDCTVGDVSQVIGPYLRDHVQRRGRSQNGLGLSLTSRHAITMRVGEVRGVDLSVLPIRGIDSFVEIIVEPNEAPRGEELDKTVLDLIAHVPREEIVFFETRGGRVAMGNVHARFPNLGALSFNATPLTAVFPNPNPDGVLASLRHVFLQNPVVNGGDWSPLMTFLSRRASSGNRLDSLEMSYSPHMCLELVERIRSMVRGFSIEGRSSLCPFGTCPIPLSSRPRVLIPRS